MLIERIDDHQTMCVSKLPAPKTLQAIPSGVVGARVLDVIARWLGGGAALVTFGGCARLMSHDLRDGTSRCACRFIKQGKGTAQSMTGKSADSGLLAHR